MTESVAPGARPGRFDAPVTLAAVGLILGIVVDRFGPQVSTFAWGVLALAAALIGLASPGEGVRLLLAFAAVGAGWHHSRWTDLGEDDLARGDWVTPRPAWVRGVIVEPPRVVPGEFADDPGRTLTAMDVTAISDGRAWRRASGRVLVVISGQRPDLASGDPMFATGSLGEVAAPRNPGESDRRDRSRAEGIRLRLSVGDAGGVWGDPEGSPRAFDRWTGLMRTRSRDLLVTGLDPDVGALAAALLLGQREAVDPDVNDAFARTGTTHLLAISGLHMHLLSWFLLAWLRLAGLPEKPAMAIVVGGTVAYAVLVGLTPSVVRSAAMTLLFGVAGWCDRCGKPPSLLAMAAIATLALNPANLFDAGCQLSFLCVFALLWLVTPALRCLGVPAPYPSLVHEVPPTRMGPEYPDIALNQLERRLAPWWKKLLRRGAAWTGLNAVASLVVWCAAEPLVQWWFHLRSPIAILLNIPLIPITSGALLAAGVTLVLAPIWAPLATPSAWICEWLLRITKNLVLWGQSVRSGHTFVPGPPTFLLGLFYAALVLAAVASFWAWKGRRWAWRALFAATLGLGLAGLVPWHPAALEAEVLAVDHGLSVVVQGPDGRVLLYDCGKMRDPRIGRRVVAPALWSRGISRVDRVILSHADSDHFNGLPDLLDRFRVGEVCVPPGFDAPANPEALALLDNVRSRGIPVRELVAGDALDLGGSARARVLHPPRGWMPQAPDNARSVVLDLGQNGEHALLTGDLEGPGLAALAQGEAPRPEVMLSPHHGARAANPEWFSRWADPGRVVVSQRRPPPSARDALTLLEQRELPVDRTWSRGAVRVEFDPILLGVVGFLDGPAPEPTWTAGRVALAVLGVVLGLAICGAAAVVHWGAWSLLVPGRGRTDRGPDPLPWTPIEARAPDGARLRGARLRGARLPANVSTPCVGTILFLHGFGEDRSGMRGRALAMAERGWGVALVDSRARGESGGHHTAFGGFEADDTRAWLDAMASRDSGVVVVWGRSMGAAIAGRVAEDPRVAAVVLEAPYADLHSAVTAILGRLKVPGWFAAPMLARAGRIAGVSLRHPRPIEVARSIATPAMILHGTADPVCPPDQVIALANAFAGTVEVIEVEGAGHADVFERGGDPLADRVARWLGDVLKPPA